MSKRAFPFDRSTPLQLKTHVESKHVNNDEASLQQIYAKTQNILTEGAKALAEQSKSGENIQQTNVCGQCNKTIDTTEFAQCSFCEKKVCAYCFNLCCCCGQNFCPLCSFISYDDREGKSYCLSCVGK